MKKTYSEKLKDPRWQRLRLRVFDRDNWTCTCCGQNDLTLHAHHLIYQKNKEPWESPLDDLVTLCEMCHEAEYKRYALEWPLLVELRRKGVIVSDIEMLTDAIRNTPKDKFNMGQLMEIILASLQHEEIRIELYKQALILYKKYNRDERSV